MSTKVFVDGQEGTTGLKIFEYLSQRADVEILRIEEAKRKDLEERRRLINASDVTFLCLPDVASRESASLVANDHTVLIDASTAFRTSADWAYGLPNWPARSASVCAPPNASPCRAATRRPSFWPCVRSSKQVSWRRNLPRMLIRLLATAAAAKK